MGEHDVAMPSAGEPTLARALRLLFWGVLIVAVDFWIEFGSFRLDLLLDIVGWIMISLTIGTFTRLAQTHGLGAGLLTPAAVCGMIESMLGFGSPAAIPPVVGAVASALAFVELLGLLSLCRIMTCACAEGSLVDLERRWWATERFVRLIALPLCALTVALGVLRAGIGWRNMNVELGVPGAVMILPILGLLAIVIALLVHFLITLHRTRIAALEDWLR